jgi:hypothetical protein
MGRYHHFNPVSGLVEWEDVVKNLSMGSVFHSLNLGLAGWHI